MGQLDADGAEWLKFIEDARTQLPPPVRALRDDGAIAGASQSERMRCEDGPYVVKFKGNPDGTRSLATEQLVAALGHFLGAPIPHVAHVEVHPDLAATITINGKPAEAGIQHGSFEEADVTERLGVAHNDEPENMLRFAALAVLYSWVDASDQQWIYRKKFPHLVWSVDHSRFLPGANGWSSASLAAAGPPRRDPSFAAMTFNPAHLKPSLLRLEAAGRSDIAVALAQIHSQWGIPDEDLVALGNFLLGRVGLTVQLFAGGV